MYVPLFADIITAERWLMIMPMAVLSNFLIYCVINAFTPGPGNILALNTVTNYGYKKGKPLFFGIFAGYYVVQIICAIFVYGVNSLLPNVMEVMKYIGAAYILWLDSYCFQQAVNRKRRAIGIVSERLHVAICQCEDLYVRSYRTNGLCCRIYVLFSGFAVF